MEQNSCNFSKLNNCLENNVEYCNHLENSFYQNDVEPNNNINQINEHNDNDNDNDIDIDIENLNSDEEPIKYDNEFNLSQIIRNGTNEQTLSIDDNLKKIFKCDLNPGISTICSEIISLMEKFKKIKSDKIIENSYIRFPLKLEKKENANELYYFIPYILNGRKSILMILDGKNSIRISIQDIIELIINNKLFINKENEDILKQAYICQEHKESFVEYCSCGRNICEKCKLYHFCHEIIEQNYMSNNEIKTIQEEAKISIIEINELFPFIESEAKKLIRDFNNKIYIILYNLYCEFLDLLTNFVYSFIIKKLLSEYFNNIRREKKINCNVEKTLKYANKRFKYNRIKRANMFNKFSSRINHFISIFPKNNNIINGLTLNNNKNAYICITKNGFVIILLFFIKDKYLNCKMKNWKYLKEANPQRIIRLDNFFSNENNDTENKDKNYFLISFPNSHEAKIILIFQEYKSILIIHKIQSYMGLITSLEIWQKSNNFILDCSDNFNVWYFDKNTKNIEKKKINCKNKYNIELNENKIIEKNSYVDYKTFKTFKPMIFIPSKNLLIIQITFPNQYLFFYTIEDIDNINELGLTFINEIKIGDNETHFSDECFNSIVIKNKFLIIGTKINKYSEQKNIGGFYIFNLDTFKLIDLIKIDNCYSVGSILNFEENKIIFNYNYIINHKNFSSGLIIYEYKEENEKLLMNERSSVDLKHKTYNSSELILNSFLICSSKKDNLIYKLDSNGNLSYLFNIQKKYSSFMKGKISKNKK